MPYCCTESYVLQLKIPGLSQPSSGQPHLARGQHNQCSDSKLYTYLITSITRTVRKYKKNNLELGQTYEYIFTYENRKLSSCCWDFCCTWQIVGLNLAQEIGHSDCCVIFLNLFSHITRY
jgi:hypothetical protein